MNPSFFSVSLAKKCQQSLVTVEVGWRVGGGGEVCCVGFGVNASWVARGCCSAGGG